ncbi:MAG: hypothetical protein JWO52_8056 [Gammaproteobacteria bacterium]|nr:hypothetical protein [Gammaproteobacteria bacterium]
MPNSMRAGPTGPGPIANCTPSAGWPARSDVAGAANHTAATRNRPWRVGLNRCPLDMRVLLFALDSPTSYSCSYLLALNTIRGSPASADGISR